MRLLPGLMPFQAKHVSRHQLGGVDPRRGRACRNST